MTEQESKPTPGKIELVHDPSLRMFQSWFVVSDLQSDTYYFPDL